MKSTVFLSPQLILGVISMSLPTKLQTDVETQDGREEMSSEISPGDTLSSFTGKLLDLRDESKAILPSSPFTSSVSSENSIIKLEDLPKRDVSLVRRAINLTLKNAVHGITGTFTWVIQIAINPNEQKSWLGPHRLGAKCQFDSSSSSSGTSAVTFSAKELTHTTYSYVTSWRIKSIYDDNSDGSLLPDIYWQETFFTFSGFWGAAIAGIQKTALQWTQNGQVETIDPSQYTLTIHDVS